jgi:hypothetical protein
LAPHRNQPDAQVAEDVVAASAAVWGTTTVMPFVLTIVVMAAAGGQLVVSQFRPVWQQPPPADARHA